VVPDSASAPVLPAPSQPGAPTFAPLDGLYLLTGGNTRSAHSIAWARATPHGVTVSIGPFTGTAHDALPGGGWRLHLANGGDDGGFVTLRPPAREGGSWHIAAASAPVTYEQRVGPLEARMRATLLQGQRFVRIDERRLAPGAAVDTAFTRDVVTVLDHGLVRVELPDGRGAACVVDALLPAVDDHGAPVPSPLPAAGSPGVVTYSLGKMGHDCGEFDPDAPAHGLDGGVRVFASTDGHIPGLLVIGYMYAELFVSPSVTRSDLAQMGKAARDESGHQAE
jgi:hypothetical protein